MLLLHTSRQHQQHQQELGEPARIDNDLQNLADPIVIRSSPFRVRVQRGANTSAEQHADTRGDGDSEGCIQKDLHLGDIDRILDVKVRDDGTPRRAGPVDDADQTQHVAGPIEAEDGGRRSDVGAMSRLAVDDHEDDEEHGPCVLLVQEHAFQPDEAEYKADACHDDDPDGDGDAAVRYGAQC